MQYGNEDMQEIANEIDGFKSYYVVWKPYEVTEAKDGKYQFKSYYVVWKLFRETQNA